MIVTDLNMPNLDGIGMIREVRKDTVLRNLPIVMLTTESQEGRKQEGKSAGATGWIVKPFKPEQLLAVVNVWLGKGNSKPFVRFPQLRFFAIFPVLPTVQVQLRRD